MEKVGKRQRHVLALRAVQAGAAEQQLDVVMQHILGDAPPEELHGGARAVVGANTGTSQFQDLARIAHEGGDVVLGRGVEAARAHRRAPPHHAIGSDHRVRARPQAAVQNHDVIAVIVEPVELAFGRGDLRARRRLHLFDEHLIAKGLRGAEFGGALGKANLQVARADVHRPSCLVLQCDHLVLVPPFLSMASRPRLGAAGKPQP